MNRIELKGHVAKIEENFRVVDYFVSHSDNSVNSVKNLQSLNPI